MQFPRQQERQMQLTAKTLVKGDNRIYRVQNPFRTEFSLSIYFFLKWHLSKSIKTVSTANPKANILFGRIGGSWWKPQFHVIIGGRTKKAVLAAAEMLQNEMNGKKNKKEFLLPRKNT